MRKEGGWVAKSVESAALTGEMLDKINGFSRRPLQEEEVFVFRVVLCDNEVDRDLERFPLESLEKLGELFLGTTGVFDHNATAENQSARIFDTALEQTGDVNSAGEGYARLCGYAYMVRCEKNADLILEIDAGIKKEVSVSCAVEQVLCSVCGEDQKTGGCAHQKGTVYEERLCHHLLVNPTDAYEWSFVAVPAQKKAGVVKRRGEPVRRPDKTVDKARLAGLERLAGLGEAYEDRLRKRVVRLGLLSGGLSGDELDGIVGKLESPQLEALEKCFRRKAEKRYPLGLQLTGPEQPKDGTDREFRI